MNGESLTSLVCRQARHVGLSLKGLLRALGWRRLKGTLDLDIAPPDQIVNTMSISMGIPLKSIQGVALDQLLTNSLPASLLRMSVGHSWRPRHSPWILPNAWQFGITLSDRTLGGIPYCPLCFSSTPDPGFPVTHRLSITVVCPMHNILLKDACPTCGYPLGPGTILADADWSLGEGSRVCVNCPKVPGADGAQILPVDPPLRAPRSLLNFQEVLHRALWGHPIEVPQIGTMSGIRFLNGLRYINTAAGFLLDHGLEPSTLSEVRLCEIQPLMFRSKVQPSIEFLPIVERVKRIAWFAWVYEFPLDRWHVLSSIPRIPKVIAKSLRHPWDGVGESGEFTHHGHWHNQRRAQREQVDVEGVNRFFDIASQLNLDDTSLKGLLGGVSAMQMGHWRGLPSLRITTDAKHRMEHFLRIMNGASGLLGDYESALRWLKRKNSHPRLDDKSPIQFLIEDDSGERFEFISRLIGAS